MYKNAEMERMMGSLRKHLDRTDIIGYAAARNTRILANELSEYSKVRDELVMKYGEVELDERGDPTGSVSLSIESDKFPQFAEEIERFARIEHDPDIFKLKFDQAIGVLSGTELLEIEWMFEE